VWESHAPAGAAGATELAGHTGGVLALCEVRILFGYCSATVRLLRVLVFGRCQAAVGAYVTTHTRWRTRARTRAGMRVRTRAQACRHALRGGSQVGEAVWSGSEDNAVRIWDKSAVRRPRPPPAGALRGRTLAYPVTVADIAGATVWCPG
jgi:hypothetical protein